MGKNEGRQAPMSGGRQPSGDEAPASGGCQPAGGAGDEARPELAAYPMGKRSGSVIAFSRADGFRGAACG
jgi:hypothetical protein